MAKYDRPYIEITTRLFIPVNADLKDLQELNLGDLFSHPSEIKVNKPDTQGKGGRNAKRKV